ncbi:hypothetical protein DOTSEDRAFT_71767 [Dothistroma septosporum NZE10]|uniref:Uncharacterized protein n=1 Tax=Dothistroma septosporum (strain NZE10 / CBS 128990) TaxID=675120 RepID=N1PL60_DOTSN|nr:hypothetical protein DOTSEDRAFT_71767 [Dothistroma septosporum NZE10]
MVLHHSLECEDIRSAFSGSMAPSDRAFHSDRGSHRSYPPSHTSSDESSHSTQPTVYSGTSERRPPRVHYNTCDDYHAAPSTTRYCPEQAPHESPRASVETYASTIPSEEDLPQELPEYEVPEYTARPYQSAAIAATPSDFSELFPSHRRMAIRHDDATLDGNMNLRVDTEVTVHGGRRCDMTLFHLRMHDLRDREFSLRRYCRDSGREVCHSSRRQQNSAAPKRPSFQRSLSNALSSMRPKSEQRSPTMASLKRNDSGYESVHSSIDMDRDEYVQTSYSSMTTQQAVERNIVKLEFSNYAQLDVRRAGNKANKRYEFEYWGTHYAWRRVVKKDNPLKQFSYHLVKSGREDVLAYIIPSPLTPGQAEEEQSKGGWIPPCSMWIADDSIVGGQKDVADVVIATGLMALVDDNIKARFHVRDSKQLLIPKLQTGMEYIGPKRLINEMFKREGTSQHSRQPSSSSRPSSSAGLTSASGTRAVVRQSSNNW